MASIFSESWIDLVFQGKNQEYGAYDLRKRSPRTAFIAGAIAIGVLATAVVAPILIDIISGRLADKKVVKVVDVNELMAPPPIDPTTPPPPPAEPPPPIRDQLKFTPPVIVPDEQIKEDDTPPTQDDLKDKDVGKENIKGDSTKGVDLSLLDTKGSDVVEDPDANKVFTVVEQMPGFPGGDGELLKYLKNNTVYPPIAKENDIEGTVYVQFVVDKSGKVGSVKVLRSVDKYLDKEAVRVVSSMPNWKPGKQNGKEVSVYYTVPIRFVLQ